MIFGRSDKLKESLTRTRQSFFGRITGLLGANEITPELWEKLEELLVLADVGVETTLALIERLKEKAAEEKMRDASQVKEALKEELVNLLDGLPPALTWQERLLTVILVVGVNGSGKTTTIGKLAHYYKSLGKKVALAAADTFRAAAIDQLKIWGERVGAEVFHHRPGADPGAVVYDAIRACLARRLDFLIIDTAGRLHTKYNLMKELEKIRNVASKQVHRAPHETLLVLDATTGQNALSQARHFKEAVDITGIALAKLDGTAKGGAVFAIVRNLGLPIRFVGTGEGVEDLAEFDPETFVEGLLG
ncbi:MAG: signal recognition particle-docking protein FtsY [Anaerolineae bacterium]